MFFVAPKCVAPLGRLGCDDVQAVMGRDLKDPRERGGLPSKALEGTEGLHEDVLRCVARSLLVAQELATADAHYMTIPRIEGCDFLAW